MRFGQVITNIVQAFLQQSCLVASHLALASDALLPFSSKAAWWQGFWHLNLMFSQCLLAAKLHWKKKQPKAKLNWYLHFGATWEATVESQPVLVSGYCLVLHAPGGFLKGFWLGDSRRRQKEGRIYFVPAPLRQQKAATSQQQPAIQIATTFV